MFLARQLELVTPEELNMQFTTTLAALGLAITMATGVAMASDNHSDRSKRDGRAEQSRSHDEASEHAARRDGSRNQDDRKHQSRDNDDNDDRSGDRSKRRSSHRS